jgi:hypothetical protein
MTKQYARMGRGWQNNENLFLGCIPKSQAPPPPAPTDLRTIPIPPFWNTMTDLSINQGNVEYIPNLPPTLERLSIQNNKLKALPEIPDSVRTMHLSENNIEKFDKLPESLSILYAKKNNLRKVPNKLPNGLWMFKVTHNELTELPSFENTRVDSVGLGSNQLRALPKFPSTLDRLGCPNNQITEIKDLPSNLRVLNCANNPLRSLKIDNLTRLDILVASDCNLSEIPVLPPPTDDGTPDDANEDRRQYFFNGNPLTPEFAALYDTYVNAMAPNQWGWLKRTPGSTRTFREGVLAEHRRLIASRKSNITAIQQTLLAPVSKNTGANWYYGPKENPAAKGMQGQFGPANLVAQFITGEKGTLEKQKLALLEKQEELGVVPEGTAAAARRRIADIAIGEGAMAEKAKLYVKPANMDAARRRLEGVEEEVVDAVVEADEELENNINNINLNENALEAALNQNNQDGGKRKRRTPRKQKSSRKTRKH